MRQDQIEELKRVHRQAVADGMVKVGLPVKGRNVSVEWCFAHRLSRTFARIANIPVHADNVHYGDVVEYREQRPRHQLLKEFVGVRTQGSTTLVCPVDRRLMRRVRELLMAMPASDRPLAIQAPARGWLASAWPLTMTDKQRAITVATAVYFAQREQE
jgi:ribosomal protein S17